MNNRIEHNITIFFIYMSLIFLFLPSLYLFGRTIPLYNLIIGSTLFILLILSKNIFRDILYFFKYRFFIMLLIYIFWIFLCGLFLVMFDQYRLINYLYGAFLLFAYNNLTWYFLPALICPKFISLKKMVRFLLFAIYVVCIYGIIIYLVSGICNLHILDLINDFIVNRRAFILDGHITTSRVYSVFEEAGYFGGFLCINLPLIYKIILSKHKLHKNKFINAFVKKTYIPIIALTIILIQSPIWFVFSIISTLIYFRKLFRLNKLKNIIIIFFSSIFIFLSSLIVIMNFDVSSTFLNRISKTFSAVKSFDMLIYAEPSLATRIIGYTIRLKTFINHPFTGVGYKNTEYHAIKVLNNSNIPLTTEVHKNAENLNKQGFLQLSGSIFWNILSDTGLIGIIFFYSFIIFSIKEINKILKNLPYSLEKNFMIGVKNSYISIICFSIYDLRPNFVYFWFLFGLTLCFILYNRKQKVILISNQKGICNGRK